MWLAVTIGVYVVALLSAATLGRLRPKDNFLTRFLLCGGLAWVMLAILELAIGGVSVETLASLLLFAFVWELSIFMFAFVSTSVSVGLLLRLRSGPRSYTELRNTYTTDFMVETRLERLVREFGVLGHPAPQERREPGVSLQEEAHGRQAFVVQRCAHDFRV